MKLFITFLFCFSSVGAFANISASPSSVNFYNVSVEDAIGQTQYVYVYNNENKETNLNIYGYCPSDFTISYYSCYHLSPYGSCSISIRFAPRNEGTQSCNLTINEQSGGGAYIWISGTGVK